MLRMVDDRIVGLHRRAAHALQRFFGVTSFRLSRWAYLAASVAFSLYVLDAAMPLTLADETAGWHVPLVFLCIASNAYMAHAAGAADEAWRACRNALPWGLLAVRRRGDVGIACDVFVASVAVLAALAVPARLLGVAQVQIAHPGSILVADAAVSCIVPLMAVGRYMLLVDPLPPGVSRVRQWVTNLSGAFRAPRAAPVSAR